MEASAPRRRADRKPSAAGVCSPPAGRAAPHNHPGEQPAGARFPGHADRSRCRATAVRDLHLRCPGEGLIEPYESVLDEILYLHITEGAHLCISKCQEIIFQPFRPEWLPHATIRAGKAEGPQSRSRLHACEPSVRRGLHGITPVPTKNNRLRGRRRRVRTWQLKHISKIPRAPSP